MPTRRLDVLARAHQYLDHWSDDDLLVELGTSEEACSNVRLRLGAVIRSLRLEFACGLDVCRNAVADVVSARRRARVQKGVP
jgi:hypothetical protein